MRVLRFLVRNWPLKLMALGLSVLLFGGMVVLQNTQTWPGEIQIEPVHQPANSFLVKPDSLPSVQAIRFVAPPDVRLTPLSFSATINLSGVTVGESSLVKVDLQVDDPRVQIVDFRPQQIRVTLDPIITAKVPVRVTWGTPPAGIEPGTPVVSAQTVQVTGPSSFVNRVAFADAHVAIDASGLDVNETPILVARDADKVAVTDVQLTPASVNVQMPVGSQLRSETVPVNPVTSGTPTPGYYITGIDISPPTVSVRGQANALAKLGAFANTKAVNIDGATGDVTANVALDLPTGVEAPEITTVKVVVHLQSPSSTRSVSVGVTLDGERPDQLYTPSVLNVLVTVGGPSAALAALDPTTLVAHVSVGGLDPGAHTLAVTIDLPPGIKLAAPISPRTIVVTITAPPTPSPAPSI